MKLPENPMLLLNALSSDEKIALFSIINALIEAKTKHPDWVNDPIHAAGILSEEAGEVMKEAIDVSYGSTPLESLRLLLEETAQTGAMAVRIIAEVLSGSMLPHRHYIKLDTQ